MIEPIDVSYFENIDYTKRNKITLYEPNIIKKIIVDEHNKPKEVNSLIKGKLILEYDYEPLLTYKDYIETCEEAKIAKELYQNLSHLYFVLFNKCMMWYAQIKAVKKAFNYEIQIESFKKRIQNESACPIIFELDENTLNNVQFKKYYQWLVDRAALNKIDSVNVLLYDLEKPTLKNRYNEIGEKIINSIQNIVYQRFLNFLERERNSSLNKLKVSKTKPISSLTSKYDNIKLKNLRKKLLNGKYINNISTENFLKCFSGKQVFPHERIVWKKAKSQGYYFFSSVSDNFTIIRLNNSVVCNKGKFDSNNKPASGYAEIDTLIED